MVWPDHCYVLDMNQCQDPQVMPDPVTLDRIDCTTVLRCGPDLSLTEAVRRMHAARCPYVIVVDAAEQPLGIWAEHDAVEGDASTRAAMAVPIRTVMRSPVWTLPGDMPLEEAVLRFLTDGVHHYVVTDRTGAPHGVVSLQDVLHGIDQAHTARLSGFPPARGEHHRPQLRAPAHHDALTEPGSRPQFRERTRSVLAAAARDGTPLALMLVNLDRFRAINDTLGYEAGDTVLREVTHRLHRVGTPRLAAMARLGGDEFGLVLHHDTQAGVRRCAQAVLDVLAAPFRAEGQDLYLTASIGIGLSGIDGDTAEALEQAADLALGQAKEGGGNAYAFHAAGMTARMHRRLTLETRLRRALEREEFVLHYQPKVDLTTLAVTGMEALVRWNSPEEGLVPPDTFLPAVEDMGLMPALGEWVLREACRQTRAWQKAGLPPLRVAVNLSPSQFTGGPQLFRLVETILCDTGLSPFHLELEITESAAMSNVDAACDTIELLAGLGVRVALDDFGTGYSSLDRLRRFPVSVLKIDKSFVNDLGTSRTGLAIPSAVISMAHALSKEVVAEGISSADQFETLRALHCETGQGFYFSPPLNARAFIRFMETTVSHPAALPAAICANPA